ncbi:MAG: PQQ-like beta-propeller repeat protein [Thermoplasmata archaeon]|nr:PQQ-like beta-propeller repeat protein [Thermoplasmata archaeon]
MNQKGLAVGLILLFIVSIVAPMVIGYKSNSTEKYNKYNLDAHRLPEVYPEQNILSESYNVVSVPQNPQQAASLEPVTVDDGTKGSAWPMYCHDTKHTGRSPYNTADNPMTEKWRFSLYGYSDHCAPVLDSQGTIYVADSHIYAIYPNGTLKWEFVYGSPVEGCPAIDEQRGVLYYGIEWDSPNYLYALYLTNGSTKWKYRANGDVSSSPAIDIAGTIYFGDWNGDVHAVYPNGTRKWMYHTGDVITSSPAIGDDDTIYIGSHDNYVYAFYPNGTLKWRFQTGNWVHASPTIGTDGTVYIGSDDMYLYALTPENGAEIWRCSIGGGTWCSPTLDKQGIIYLGTSRMKFHAIYPNGTIKWTYDAPGRIWFGSSAALSNDGILYFGTTWMDGGEGAFIALNADDGSERFIDIYGDYETSPAIASDGTVYAVTIDFNTGVLHAFGSNESKKISILQPKVGRCYLFGLNVCPFIKKCALVIGSVTVKVEAPSVEQLYNISFYIDNTLQFVDTQPPFEWNMNHRFGKRLLMSHQLTVIGYYKGGCYSAESINVRYFHLLKN